MVDAEWNVAERGDGDNNVPHVRSADVKASVIQCTSPRGKHARRFDIRHDKRRLPVRAQQRGKE